MPQEGKNTLSFQNLIREKNATNSINYSGFACTVILGLLIFLAYFKLFRFVSHHNHTVVSNLQQENPSHIKDRKEAKITKTLVIVVLGFAARWPPLLAIPKISEEDPKMFRLNIDKICLIQH